MRKTWAVLLALAAAAICVVIALFAWSTDADQKQFAAAKNECERKCIQDSGGLDACRAGCTGHPDRYP